MAVSDSKRKLIDLSGPVFAVLTWQARKEGISLKKYIERLLEEDAARHRSGIPSQVTDPRILGLVGIGKGVLSSLETASDDRLQYILSK